MDDKIQKQAAASKTNRKVYTWRIFRNFGGKHFFLGIVRGFNPRDAMQAAREKLAIHDGQKITVERRE